MKAKRRMEILSQVDPKCRLVAGSVALTEPAASHASQGPQELSFRAALCLYGLGFACSPKDRVEHDTCQKRDCASNCLIPADSHQQPD